MAIPLRLLGKIVAALLGGVILAFGLYQVHACSGITEGGILGLTLLLQHWFRFSPAWSGLLLNAICYILGWRTFGFSFILCSCAAGAGFSFSYALFEQFPALWPQLSVYPLAAALLGALFVGVGAGISVRAGGAPSGDDALAMSLSKLLHCKIERIYLASDLIVLGLSMTYLPLARIGYSLLSVVLSGLIVGLIQRLGARNASIGTNRFYSRAQRNHQK